MVGRSDREILRKINKTRSSSVQLTLMDSRMPHVRSTSRSTCRAWSPESCDASPAALVQEIHRAMSPKTKRRVDSNPIEALSRSFDSLRLGGTQ
jgi:hypothetical protein